MLKLRSRSLVGLASASLLIALALAPAASAHTPHAVGEYQLEIGWLHEPALVAQPNAVQVTIVDGAGKPVTDLALDVLSVVVSTAGQDGPSLSLLPAFDAEEGLGPLGEYDAVLVPTAPGDYTFHIKGSIHGTAVDITVASGAETFDPVVASTDLEFPAKLPNLTEVATRLDRIDARVAALQSANPGSAALDAANAAVLAAKSAADTANQALLLGGLMGGGGIVLALLALVVAARARRAGSST